MLNVQLIKGKLPTVFAFLILCVLIFTLHQKYIFMDTLNPEKEESILISDNWKYNWEGSSSQGLIQVPGKIKGKEAYQKLLLTNILPIQEFRDSTLFIRTSQQSIKVFVNNNLVYTYGNVESGKRADPPGSLWHLIKLPSDYQGLPIQIELKSPYTQYTGLVNEIRIGSKSSHILMLVKRYIGSFIIGGIIVLIGILLIILFFLLTLRSYKFYGVLFLGLFSILSGVWIVSESKFIQFFISSPIFLLNLAFMILFLMPIALIMFILTTFKPQKSKGLIFLIYVLMLFFIVSTGLHFFNIVPYMIILPFFNALLFICLAHTIFVSIYELKCGNKEIKSFFIGCTILCIFSVTDLVGFYFSKLPGLNAQGGLQFGILGFIFMMIISISNIILKLYDLKARSQIYETLAYTDILTGFKNRTYFENRITELNSKLSQETNIMIIVFDLNNLKDVNDNLGHKAGDKMICASARIIQESFSKIGEVFRIGGDEFVAILTGQNLEYSENAIYNFIKRIEENNMGSSSVKISIAHGFSVYKEGDKNLYSVFTRADKAMYNNKKQQKESIIPCY